MLSKMSGESELSMEDKLRLLYEHQLADSQLDSIYLLRGELPLEVQDLEDDIFGLTTRVGNIQAEVKAIEKDITQRKLDVDNARALVEKYTTQQSNVKNNREYDSLSKEIEYQGLEADLAEKRIREFSVVLKERKEQLEVALMALADRQIDLENKKKELEVIVRETAKEEEEIKKRAEQIETQIDERMLNAYKKVRNNARNGLAVVTVKRDACGGCYNKIPPQKQLDIRMSKRIIVCEYCGRILVNGEFEGR
ncbi:MAG: C4-type zinc ribbon domain-containing protein [Prevotellaceae bacterium]|nr:C4-type zinc ribbon domain-containing protein [Prevotellaceae bacterium]